MVILRRPLALEDRLLCFPFNPLLPPPPPPPPPPLPVLSFLSCWCGATFFVRAFFVVEAELRGPALPARLEAGVPPPFGVPGPSED